jgi:hypothetical protein
MHWLTRSWWRYLLNNPDYRGRKHPVRSWNHFWCRVRGHRCGPVWYNAGGIEPDMHCRNCGDDLG